MMTSSRREPLYRRAADPARRRAPYCENTRIHNCANEAIGLSGGSWIAPACGPDSDDTDLAQYRPGTV